MPPMNGKSTEPDVPGVLGESTQYNGVLGVSTANGHSGVAGVHDEGVGNGVYGRSKGGDGVQGFSSAEGHAGVAGANDDGNGIGVYGRSTQQAGVYGESKGFNGVRGVTYSPGNGAVVGISENHTPQAGPGVFGQSDATGVWGTSKTWMGVYGNSESTTGGAGVMGEHKGAGTGVKAVSKDGVGLAAYSTSNEAIHAETNSNIAAIAAYNLNAAGTGFALYGKKEGDAGFAGFFDGNVWVSKTLTVGVDIVLANADCAEDFDIAGLEVVEPGTVMVIDSEGALRQSDRAYDKRVAGVISGAGNYKPGIVLDKQESSRNRMPIALMGKVYCKVDASYGAIEVGDLLTTSPTPGHAMKTDDPLKAFGAVIGKALRSLEEGQGLIPILIALQ